MTGVTLSRWTMSFFAAALIALLAAEIMMMAGYGFPAAPVEAPETLVLVHTVAIGWLSLLMCGALFQFVPVLVARPLYSDTLPLPTLILLVAGLGTLILGFLQLSGTIGQPPPFFIAAGLLLGLGFGLVVWNLARTLLLAPALPLPARFVSVGLVGIVVTAAFGIIFAFVLGGATTYEPLAALTARGVPIHAVAGLGAWLTFTAMGVSYRLLAMFMLVPDLERTGTKAGFYLGALALTVAVASGLSAVLLQGDIAAVLLLAAGLGLASLLLYGRDMLHLYRARKRRLIELNSRMAALALVSLAACAVLITVLVALGRLGDHLGAVVFLVAFGWLSGLGLSQLYKIVAFLTWLECYGPVLGKRPTPRVQDLVVETRASWWFATYFVAVWAGTAALLTDQAPTVFRLCAALMFAATCGIVVQLVRTRVLANVKADTTAPQTTPRPHLLYSLADQSR